MDDEMRQATWAATEEATAAGLACHDEMVRVNEVCREAMMDLIEAGLSHAYAAHVIVGVALGAVWRGVPDA